MPKPPLGKVAVGDRLLVTPATYSNRIKQEPVLAVVTKAARVWIDLTEVTDGPRPRTWRLRLDTQNQATGYSGDRFLTPAQYAWERQIEDARGVLREAMVDVYRGPWAEDDRLLALAEFIRTYDQQQP